jgi:hypothetical protein
MPLACDDELFPVATGDGVDVLNTALVVGSLWVDE